MKTNTAKAKQVFSVAFNELVEGTAVVSVKAEDAIFEVNCQYETDHNYKQSGRMSCSNDSGCDYYTSGLSVYVDEHFADDADEIHEYLKEKIDSVAQANLPDNTVEQHLLDEFGSKFTEHDDRIFGANYGYNCTFRRYDEVDGERVAIVAIDTDEPRVALGVKKVGLFDDYEEYKAWFNNQVSGEGDATALHYGDCRLAKRAFDSLPELR